MSERFSKTERLCSKKTIDTLFAEGHRMMAFPFSVHWLAVAPTGPRCQVMIVAPKRKFKHAVDRNHVRRLTRECYRRQKADLYSFLEANNMHIALSLIYVHNEPMTYTQIAHRMEKLIASLKAELTKASQA